MEKTSSTFHASNVVLQQQYREKGFKKYSELITCLLVAEKNNTLLMKIHEARPTGPAPFLEVNAVAAHNKLEENRIITVVEDMVVNMDVVGGETIIVIMVEINWRTVRVLKLIIQKVKLVCVTDVL